MRSEFLPFSPPDIGAEEIMEVTAALSSGWLTTGPRVKEFETVFANYLHAPAALAVSSATDAMLVGLAALGVGPGDEVITTTMTFCSTLHVIEHVGARPVLVDIQPDTLNIDPARIAAAVTPRTRAIMPVHLYGHPCDIDYIQDIADAHHLYVLEDAAHALPARFKGSTIGTLGTLTAFSFYATKNLTTGEGGMLTGDPSLIDLARIWSLHGMSRDAFKRYQAEGSWFYEVVLPGFKCNMTDLAAAIGLVQLHRLPELQARRRALVRRYNEAFAALPELELPTVRPDVEPAWHIYAVRLNLQRLTIDRARFINELKQRNIGASVHFIPNHLQPYYRDKYAYKPEDFPVAYREYQRLVSLPLSPAHSDTDIADVIAAVTDICTQYRR